MINIYIKRGKKRKKKLKVVVKALIKAFTQKKKPVFYLKSIMARMLK